MPILSSAKAEREAILAVAKMIMAAVTTSPKGRGVSAVTSVLIHGEEKEKLAKAMEDQFLKKGSRIEIFKSALFRSWTWASRWA
jgi:uncharacterized ferredoxin-like protein